MGTPKREFIMQNLVSTLSGITVKNGYHNDIKAVYRYEQAGNSAKLQPFIEVIPTQEIMEQEPVNFYTCTLSIDLDVWVRHDKSDYSASTDALLISLVADVVKAIMADETRGGYALNTKITGNYPFEIVEGQAYAGVSISVDIIYRHLITDPEI